ncbi:transposase [Vibrio sp. WXL210]|uniref:transposase n=1 Tax=Vibrio sp. WXL210 TaxID=3450709 RepID=UPI003EC6DC8F
MTTARKQLISTDVTSYYHCISRCVRRSFLCRKDPKTEISYEHRREWIEQKIQLLTSVYCIDICAFAIMSNHYHLVVNINKERALNLSHDDVVERWGYLHKLPTIIKRWQAKQLNNELEKNKALKLIETWRLRLWCLSWFMKELNYDIACKANREDNCTGHFWESRFKSQALLDEKALASAMAYVDLNPVRAGTAKTPESSEFTSIKARIDALSEMKVSVPYLHPFVGSVCNQTLEGIPFRLIEYIELVDWTARQFQKDKAYLDETVPPILDRLGFNQHHWLKICTQFEVKHSTAVGSRALADQAKSIFNKKKLHLYQLN